MMTLTTVAGTPVTIKVGDKDVAFHPLTMGDMAALSDEFYREQQAESARSIKLLLDAGIKQDQLPMLVRELERRPAYSEVRRWVFTSRGAVAALVRSARSTGITTEVVNGWMAEIDIHELALQLIGLGATPETEGSSTVPLPEASIPIETG